MSLLTLRSFAKVCIDVVGDALISHARPIKKSPVSFLLCPPLPGFLLRPCPPYPTFWPSSQGSSHSQQFCRCLWGALGQREGQTRDASWPPWQKSEMFFLKFWTQAKAERWNNMISFHPTLIYIQNVAYRALSWRSQFASPRCKSSYVILSSGIPVYID